MTTLNQRNNKETILTTEMHYHGYPAPLLAVTTSWISCLFDSKPRLMFFNHFLRLAIKGGLYFFL